MELYADTEYHLTRPYSWTNENLRNKVLQYANSLLWCVFGMTEERESKEDSNLRSDGRGFSSVNEYIEHSQCAVFLAKEGPTGEAPPHPIHSRRSGHQPHGPCGRGHGPLTFLPHPPRARGAPGSRCLCVCVCVCVCVWLALFSPARRRPAQSW